MKGVSKTIENEAKDQKRGLPGMLLDILSATLLENVLTGKGAIATSQGQSIIRAGEVTFRAGEGTIRAGKDF